MTDAGIYRRYGLAFSGTRPTIRLGDPGIDRRWLRRYHWGAAFATIWFVALPLGLVVGFMSRWGVFGRADTWQLETFGSGNVILLTLLFTPLMFLPHAIAHVAKIGGSTPFLLGMRQAIDGKWGPRMLGDPHLAMARLQWAQRIAIAAAVLGALTVAGGIWKWQRDAGSPHAPLPQVSFATLVDGTAPMPDAIRLTGAVADRSKQWDYAYSVRQDTHDDVYYALRPAGQPSATPVKLVELDQTSPQYGVAPWNMVDAPGAREGLPTVLGDWETIQLRHAGLVLGPRVIVLKRQQLHGVSPYPDPFDNILYIILGSVALFVGGLFTIPLARMRRTQADVG